MNQFTRYATICCLSIVPAVIARASGAMQWLYVAVAVLILCLAKKEALAASFLAALIVSVAALAAGSTLLPRTYDATLWRIDGCLGFDPSAYAMALLHSSAVLVTIAGHCYVAFPIAIAIATVCSRNSWRFGAKIGVACVLGYVAYYFVPACGPIYFLTGKLAAAPRNAMPSLHLTWALLVWRELRIQSVLGRLFGDVFLVLTIIATVGLGEHYLVDLIAAVPFWLFVERLCGFAYHRLHPFRQRALRVIESSTSAGTSG